MNANVELQCKCTDGAAETKTSLAFLLVWNFGSCRSYVVTWGGTQSWVLTAPRCFLTNKLLCVFCFTSVLNASLSSPEGDKPLSHISSSHNWKQFHFFFFFCLLLSFKININTPHLVNRLFVCSHMWIQGIIYFSKQANVSLSPDKIHINQKQWY